MAAKSTAPVEAKVQTTTLVVFGFSLLIAIVQWVSDHADLLIAGVPNWLGGVLTVVVVPGCTFLVGWLTRHTPRPGEDSTG